MSWRDELQPASFRGVGFHVTERRGGAGRRYALHEYPQKDLGWAEDMGGHHAPQTLEAFVIGANHFTQRNHLIEALNQIGPGTLVHPSLGSLQVQIGDCTWRESSREGGMTTFTINYVLAGEQKYPAAKSSAVPEVNSAVEGGLTALQTGFTKSFTITSLPGWVARSANEWIGRGFTLLRPFIDVADTTSDMSQTLGSLSASLDTLLATPGSLASRVSGLMSNLFGSSSGIDQARSMQRQLIDKMATAKASETLSTATPSRLQQVANRDAIIDLFTVAASILTVEKIVAESEDLAVDRVENSPFASYDEAIAIRDEQLELLDVIITSTTTSDDLYLAIRDLQTALIKHIAAHGFRLQSVATYTPFEELPALGIAHLLYGDATRENDIVRRNNIRHPGFILAGSPLEVLNG